MARLFPGYPQFAFIDELISATVIRDPAKRIANASDLGRRVQETIDRIEAGGHVLDLTIPQRCLYCAAGNYRAAHDHVYIMGLPQPGYPKFPSVEQRRAQENPSYPEQSKYAAMRGVANDLMGAK